MQLTVNLGPFSVRAFPVEGQAIPWLSLVDICQHLGTMRSADAATQFSSSEQRTISIQKTGPGTKRAIVVAPQAALRFIFRSRSLVAEQAGAEILASIAKVWWPDLYGATPEPAHNKPSRAASSGAQLEVFGALLSDLHAANIGIITMTKLKNLYLANPQSDIQKHCDALGFFDGGVWQNKRVSSTLGAYQGRTLGGYALRPVVPYSKWTVEEVTSPAGQT